MIKKESLARFRLIALRRIDPRVENIEYSSLVTHKHVTVLMANV